MLTKAEQWELALRHMGYMAILRNLDGLDRAGLSDEVASQIAARLSDPREVAASRQLPFRFLTAHLAVRSVRWAAALEAAVQLSLPNVPELPGQTLVLIDTSGSMRDPLSSNGVMTRVNAAALFALALALKNPGSATVYGFADSNFLVTGVERGASLLRAVDTFARQIGRVGHGTRIEENLRAVWQPRYDRVAIFTDMQTFAPSGFGGGSLYHVGDVSAAVPPDVPVYAFNLAGYTHSAMPVGHGRRFELGGLTDHTFRFISAMEAGQNERWPWLQTA